MAPKADVKLTFPPWIEQHGIVAPLTEHRFHKPRMWRFDFAWPLPQIALEMEGGVFGYRDERGNWQQKGAHSSVEGMLRDIDKYNAAQVAGWTVLRVIPSELFSLHTVAMLRAAFDKLAMDPGEARGAEAQAPAPQEHVPGAEDRPMTRNNSGRRSTPRGQAMKNESPEQAMESYDAKRSRPASATASSSRPSTSRPRTSRKSWKRGA